MRRLQIQLDEPLYDVLRRRAFEEQASMASMVRETLRHAMGVHHRQAAALEDFRFIDLGSNDEASASTVSEDHDDDFAAAIAARFGQS